MSTWTDHKSWPINNRQQLLIYGEDAIQVSSQHFEALLNHHHFNLQSCLDEWMEIKMHLQRERTKLQYRTSEFWKGKFQVREHFPNLSCYPSSNCLLRERQFRSQQDHVRLPFNTWCFYCGSTHAHSINGVSPEHYHSALTVARSTKLQ